MLDNLHKLIQSARAEIAERVDLQALEDVRVRLLGKKGEITSLLKSLGSMEPEARKIAGAKINEAKDALTKLLDERRTALEAEKLAEQLATETLDVTLPGRGEALGGLHPVTRVRRRIEQIFRNSGFAVADGPEIEDDWHNFEALNIPANHPARAMHDTFYFGDGRLLRTHTSPVQVHVMQAQQPPVRVIVPGRAFRFEAQDASHEWQFTQLEGLAVDRHITMADLKGTLQELARQLFGPDRRIRFRCDFFPFVEPGVDFAVDCAICNGKGCRVCKHTGWLEMGGAGMVHPNVLRGVGYDPDKVSGFAFGLGIDRLAMMKYGVDDVRAFANNDIRFLRDFSRALA